MHTTSWIVRVALGAALLLTGCDGTSDAPDEQSTDDQPTSDQPTIDQPTSAGDQVVELVDFEIITPTGASPGTFAVRNTGNAPHTLTADDGTFDTGTLQPGEETTVTIEATGPVAVRCEIHPDAMRGTIDLG